MGRLKTIARRSFLVGSAAIFGGVAFGIYTVRKPHENPLTAGPDDAVLTPYVKITSDGITLITPRADSGQGAYHVQAALIAEELDVDLDQIKADPGPPSPAYWNTALATEAAEFIMPAAGVMQDIAEGALNSVFKVTGLQITGGFGTGTYRLGMAQRGFDCSDNFLRVPVLKIEDIIVKPQEKMSTVDGYFKNHQN